MDLIAAYDESEDDDYDYSSTNTNKRAKTDSELTVAVTVGEDEAGEDSLPVPFENNHIDRSIVVSGRVRTFPHIDGNFATSVFIQIDNTPALDAAITDILESLAPTHPFIRSQYNTFHVSLSRTFPIRKFQIKGFVDDIRLAVREFTRFQATLGHCCLFQNDTATRSFVGMCVSDGVSRVIDLIHSIDNVLRERGLETYYEPAKPHVSIGWSVSALPASLDKWSYIPDAVVPFTIDQVFVQSGIKTYPCKMI